MMFDFAALKQQPGANHQQVTLELRVTMMQILSRLTMPESLAPTFILNTLAIAVAYLQIHTHQQWTTIVEDLISCLSSSYEQACCMLCVLKYKANDSDNETIVIEDSIRRLFFKAMDSIAREKVFKGILDQWSLKISQEPD
jgi:hypothetical protein